MNDTSRRLSPKTIAFFSLPLSLPKHKRVAMRTHYYNERSEARSGRETISHRKSIGTDSENSNTGLEALQLLFPTKK